MPMEIYQIFFCRYQTKMEKVVKERDSESMYKPSVSFTFFSGQGAVDQLVLVLGLGFGQAIYYLALGQ